MKQNQDIEGCLMGCTGLTITVAFAGFIALFTDSLFLGAMTLLIGVVVCCAIMESTKTKDAKANNQDLTVNFREDGEGGRTLTETEFFCKIAGAHHHNNRDGGFLGVVVAEPLNPYDKNAIAIYTISGKLVGYIPKEEQKSFKAWSTRNNLPCVGYIYTDYNGRIQGKVKVIDGDKNITEIHIYKLVIWMIENYGLKYIPRELHSLTTARNENEWLDFLYQELDECKKIKKGIDKKRKELDKANANQPTSQS